MGPPHARGRKTMDHGVEIDELRAQHFCEFLAPDRCVASIPGLAAFESPRDGGASVDGGAGQC